MNKSDGNRRTVPRTAGALEQVWQSRTDLVRHQMDAESKANDAKTARLKALRLAKEQEDALARKDAPAPKSTKRTPRVTA